MSAIDDIQQEIERLGRIARSNGAASVHPDAWREHAARLTDLYEKLSAVRMDLEREASNVNAAYGERNKLVAALANVFPAGIKTTAIDGWDPAWHNCVYVDLPTGQVSWHYHDDERPLFDHLDPYPGSWDGHDTETKYARVAGLAGLDTPAPAISAGLAGNAPVPVDLLAALRSINRLNPFGDSVYQVRDRAAESMGFESGDSWQHPDVREYGVACVVVERYLLAGPPTAELAAPAPDVAAMVDRFLGWRLPADFAPDAGISFTPTPFQRGEQADLHWPVGTNLFTAVQARAMFEHALGLAPA